MARLLVPRARPRLPRISLILMAAGFLMMFASGARAAGGEVIVLPTTGIVDEGMSKYLADNIRLAEERNVAAVVVKLNTPGGSIFSMQEITGTILGPRPGHRLGGARRRLRRAPARSSPWPGTSPSWRPRPRSVRRRR